MQHKSIVRVIAAFVLCLGLHIALAAELPDSRYSMEMFRTAIKNHSTSPSYILITVVDAVTGDRRTICIEAPALLGALHRTARIPYDLDGQKQVTQMAIDRADRVFVLSPEEIATIEPKYTPDMADKVRTLMSQHDDAELRNIGVMRQIRTEAVGAGDFRRWREYQGAIAHVLLERGIPCNRDDRSSGLVITARDR
jgi:hypothetical protein